MEYRIIKMRTCRGHLFIELEIDGKKAYINSEQKPTLFSEGYIFVEPQEEWRERLPVINYITPDGYLLLLKGFIRSLILLPVIIDMNGTVYPSKFNKKWAGKVLYEDEERVIREQESRESKRIKR